MQLDRLLHMNEIGMLGRWGLLPSQMAIFCSEFGLTVYVHLWESVWLHIFIALNIFQLNSVSQVHSVFFHKVTVTFIYFTLSFLQEVLMLLGPTCSVGICVFLVLFKDVGQGGICSSAHLNLCVAHSFVTVSRILFNFGMRITYTLTCTGPIVH